MFGLMQPTNSCGQKQDNNYRHHRMHYCGTCKAIGQQYGHKSRLTLNFDTVFLAELLSHLANEQTQEWSNSLQAINRCFTMPKKGEKLPLSLQYAGTANILLTELKVKDHIEDSNQKRWKLANWSLSKPFKKAKKQLANWDINSQQFQDLATQQKPLEQAKPPVFIELKQQLSHYAQPTAQMTALVFQNAAKVLKLTTKNIAQDLANLGFAFGQLAYMLDALEDIEKDIAQAQFNPLVQWYGITKTPTEQQLSKVQELILAQKDQVVALLQELPIEQEWLAVYAGRLTSNVANSIYQKRKVLQTTKEVVQTRWQTAKEKASQLTCQPKSLGQKLNYYLVSVAVFMTPEALPIEPNEKAIFWKSLAIFSAMLFSLGLAGKLGLGRVPKSRRPCCDFEGMIKGCGRACAIILFITFLVLLLVFLVIGILGLVLGPLVVGIVFISLFGVGAILALIWFFTADDLKNDIC